MWFGVAVVMAMVGTVWSHGYLFDPPGRSSMWRAGFAVEKNFNDNELNCGGFGNQWGNQGGKCGVCGDPWQGPRENEPPGGKYAKNIISKQYVVGSVMTARVRITADHLGYFEFRLCKKEAKRIPVKQRCLNRNLLTIIKGPEAPENNSTRYYTLGVSGRNYRLKIQLPQDFYCRRCVLQWRYHTGNSWGCEDDGRCCRGCGRKQEEFYACADISIKYRHELVGADNIGTMAADDDDDDDDDDDMVEGMETNETDEIDDGDEIGDVDEGDGDGDDGDTTAVAPVVSMATEETSPSTVEDEAVVAMETENGGEDKLCVATGVWAGSPSMAAWCSINCNAGFCPESYCICH